MVYLWLAIGCSTLIALILKHTENRDMNRFSVLSANYFTATSLSLLLWSLAPKPEHHFEFRLGWQQLMDLFAGKESHISFSASAIWAVMVGLVAGIFFFTSFFCYQNAVRRHGVALSSAFLKLGFVVPMFFSIVLWSEFPTPIQWVGIGLALSAFALVNWPSGELWREALHPLLFLLCFVGGMAEFSKKVFQQFGLQEQKALFLMVTFGMAFFLSIFAILRNPRPVLFRDLSFGVLLGIPNIFASFFLVKALGILPAAVAFPFFGAGTIALVFAAGTLFFGEKLRTKETLAIGMIILAMVFH